MNPIERILGGFHWADSLVEATHYSSPRTVGTARVKNIVTIKFEEKPEFDVVTLDIKKERIGDCSETISKVPAGMFKPEDITAEVIVKTSESTWYEPEGTSCQVAIRPFRPNTYGKPIDESDPQIKAMFETNVKDYSTCSAFFRKFMS